MNEKELIEYYNKFNEDKRLNTRHGQVEFLTTMKYIKEYLKEYKLPKIIDIGAGTGKYAIELKNMGYMVEAVDIVKHNLKVIEKKDPTIKLYHRSATDLKKIEDNQYDIVLLLGPMYHLLTEVEKLKALKEAKRVCKQNGFIFVAYLMNEYCIIRHGFKEKSIKEAIKNDMINEDFKIIKWDDNLYSPVRVEDIDKYNKKVGFERIKIISPDGPANYIRKELNKLDDEEFLLFLEYHYKTCERTDLIGSCAHTLDILKCIK